MSSNFDEWIKQYASQPNEQPDVHPSSGMDDWIKQYASEPRPEQQFTQPKPSEFAPPTGDWFSGWDNPAKKWDEVKSEIPVVGYWMNPKNYEYPTIEEQKIAYKPHEEVDYTWGGVKVPHDFPLLGGLSTAFGKAWQKPTGGFEGAPEEFVSKDVRDQPLWGGVSRVGETAFNLLNEPYQAVGEPAGGFMSTGLTEVADWVEQATTPGKKFRPLENMAKRELEASKVFEEEKGRKFVRSNPEDVAEMGRIFLYQTPAVTQVAAAFALDPLNFIPGAGIGGKQVSKAVKAFEKIPGAPVALDTLTKVNESKSVLGRLLPWFDTTATRVHDAVNNASEFLIGRGAVDNYANVRKLIDQLPTSINDEATLTRVAKEFGENTTSRAGQTAARLLTGVADDSKASENAFKAALGSLEGKHLAGKLSQPFEDALSTIRNKGLTGADAQNAIEEAAKADLIARASKRMAENANSIYKLPPPNLVQKMVNELRAVEALVYIGLSPITLARNWINNKVTMMLEGVNPFLSTEKRIAKLRALNNPKAIAQADMLQKVQSMSKQTFKIRDEVNRALQNYESATSSLGGRKSALTQKIPSLLKVYENIENFDRMLAWETGVYRALKSNWLVGKWIPGLSEGELEYLMRVDPSGALWKSLQNAAEASGLDRAARAKFFEAAKQGKIPPIDMANIANQYGMSKDALLANLGNDWLDIYKGLLNGIVDDLAAGVRYEDAVDKRIQEMLNGLRKNIPPEEPPLPDTALGPKPKPPSTPPTQPSPPVDELTGLKERVGEIAKQYSNKAIPAKIQKELEDAIARIDELESQVDTSNVKIRPPEEVPPIEAVSKTQPVEEVAKVAPPPEEIAKAVQPEEVAKVATPEEIAKFPQELPPDFIHKDKKKYIGLKFSELPDSEQYAVLDSGRMRATGESSSIKVFDFISKELASGKNLDEIGDIKYYIGDYGGEPLRSDADYYTIRDWFQKKDYVDEVAKRLAAREEVTKVVPEEAAKVVQPEEVAKVVQPEEVVKAVQGAVNKYPNARPIPADLDSVYGVIINDPAVIAEQKLLPRDVQAKNLQSILDKMQPDHPHYPAIAKVIEDLKNAPLDRGGLLNELQSLRVQLQASDPSYQSQKRWLNSVNGFLKRNNMMLPGEEVVSPTKLSDEQLRAAIDNYKKLITDSGKTPAPISQLDALRAEAKAKDKYIDGLDLSLAETVEDYQKLIAAADARAAKEALSFTRAKFHDALDAIPDIPQMEKNAIKVLWDNRAKQAVAEGFVDSVDEFFVKTLHGVEYGGTFDPKGLAQALMPTNPDIANKLVEMAIRLDKLGLERDAFAKRGSLLNAKLKQKEIDALTKEYRALYKSATNVLYQMKDPTIIDQLAGKIVLGATTPMADGKSLIQAFKGANVYTLAHESAHVWRKTLPESTVQTLEKIYNITDGVWQRGHEEKFARQFEKYLAEGYAPTPELKSVFDQFKEWLVKIYKQITGSDIDVEMSDEVRQIFDEMLAGDDIRRALKVEERAALGEIFTEQVRQSGTPWVKQINRFFDANGDDIKVWYDRGTGQWVWSGKSSPIPGIRATTTNLAVKKPQIVGNWKKVPIGEAGDAGRAIVDWFVENGNVPSDMLQQGDDWAKFRDLMVRNRENLDEFGNPFKVSKSNYIPVKVLDEYMAINSQKLDTFSSGRLRELEAQYPDIQRQAKAKAPETELESLQRRYDEQRKRVAELKNIAKEKAGAGDTSGAVSTRAQIEYLEKSLKSQGMRLSQLKKEAGKGALMQSTPISVGDQVDVPQGVGKVVAIKSNFAGKNTYSVQLPDGKTVKVLDTDIRGASKPMFEEAPEELKLVSREGRSAPPAQPMEQGSLFQTVDENADDILKRAGNKQAEDITNGASHTDEQNAFMADFAKKLRDELLRARPTDLDAAVAGRVVNNWQKRINDMDSDAALAATKHGDWLENATVLDYNRRMNIDNWMSYLMPFPFWRNHYAIETLRRAVDYPRLTAFYINAAEKLQKQYDDPTYPKRLKGKSWMPLPFLPEWMNRGVLFDPLETLVPVKQVFGMNNYQNTVSDEDIKQTIGALLQNNKISAADAEYALTYKGKADLWNKVKKDMEARSTADGGLGELFSYHKPLELFWKARTGSVNDVGVLFPFTRLGRAAESMGIPGGKEVAGIEPKLREMMGLPEHEAGYQYRIDRMLATLVSQGEISAQDAALAMIERTGKAYDLAYQRAGQETAAGTLLPLTGTNVLPQGERAYYLARVARDMLLDKEIKAKGGDPTVMSTSEKWDYASKNGITAEGTPFQKFLKQHPEIDLMNSAMYDTEEKRLKDYLVETFWTQYMDKFSKLERKLFAQEVGDPELIKFIDRDTRDSTKISLDQLGEWVKLAGAYVPKGAGLATPQKDLSGVKPLKLATPQESAAYAEWDKAYQAVRTIQDEYYRLKNSGGDYRGYLNAHPELKAYWDFSDQWKQRYPELSARIWGTPKPTTTAPVNNYQQQRPSSFGSGGSGGYTPRSSGGGGYTSRSTGGGTTTTTKPFTAPQKYPGDLPEIKWQDVQAELADDSELMAQLEEYLSANPDQQELILAKYPKLKAWLYGKGQKYRTALGSAFITYKQKAFQPPTNSMPQGIAIS